MYSFFLDTRLIPVCLHCEKEPIMREIFGTICIAGAIQAVLLFFALIIKRNNRRANLFLSIFMFFTAVDALELYLASRGHVLFSQPYQVSIIPYSFVFGPSLFLYSALMTARIDRLTRRHLLLYAPFLVILTANIILFLFFDTPVAPRAVPAAHMIIGGGGFIFEAILYAASLRMIHAYTARLKEYFSAIDTLKLSLFRAALAVLFIVVIVFFLSLISEGGVRREYKLPDIIAVLVSMGLGFAFALMAMIQPEIFNRVRLMEKAVPGDAGGEPSPKYEKLRLPDTKEEQYSRMLKELMEDRKLYLKEELTLQDLADELSLSPQHLSMLLNVRFRQNFYNFVNAYRVEEVKRKLADPACTHGNILSIAFGAGFNSKSTFNTMFKKFTGKTPKQFRADLSA